jgi:hypothetical protein
MLAGLRFSGLRRRLRAARPSLRVDRWRLSATAAVDGWSPVAATRRQNPAYRPTRPPHPAFPQVSLCFAWSERSILYFLGAASCRVLPSSITRCCDIGCDSVRRNRWAIELYRWFRNGMLRPPQRVRCGRSSGSGSGSSASPTKPPQCARVGWSATAHCTGWRPARITGAFVRGPFTALRWRSTCRSRRYVPRCPLTSNHGRGRLCCRRVRTGSTPPSGGACSTTSTDSWRSLGADPSGRRLTRIGDRGRPSNRQSGSAGASRFGAGAARLPGSLRDGLV